MRWRNLSANHQKKKINYSELMTRWWFESFFIFTPKIGEDFPFDEHIFQMGGSTTNQMRNFGTLWGHSARPGFRLGFREGYVPKDRREATSWAKRRFPEESLVEAGFAVVSGGLPLSQEVCTVRCLVLVTEFFLSQHFGNIAGDLVMFLDCDLSCFQGEQ